MFGVGYFASNADEYFMVLNNQNFSLGIIDDNPEKYKVRNQFGVSVMPRKGVVMLSSLLPPPEAISAYLEGRYDIGANIYGNFLNNDVTCQNIISVLLKLFYTGRNIVLFVPKDEATSLNFIPVLGNYLFNLFGVRVGDIRNPQSAFTNPNEVQFANMLNCMYLYDNLSFIDLCMHFPDNICMNEAMANKIIADNKITLEDIVRYSNNPSPTMEDIVNFANGYARSIRSNTNRGIMEANKQYRRVISSVPKDSDNK